MPYKRILFAGSPISADLRKDDTLEAVAAKTAGNTGNMLIAHSLWREVRYETARHWRYDGDPAELRENFDAIVFPAANTLNPSYDFGHIADAIEKVNLPCVMAGLGAQSRNDGNPRLALKEGTVRLVKIISERGKCIGVRGEFTASVLAELGIHNFELTGCPSFYSSLSPELALRRKPPGDIRRVALNGSRRVFKGSFDPERMRAVENALLTDALNYDTEFFAQNGAEEIQLALDPDRITDARLEPLTSYYSSVAPGEVIRFFRNKTRLFGSIDEWRDALSSFDLVIGTRIHGCVLGMLAGVPPILVTHDTRTQEMSRLLGLPQHRMDDPALFDPAKGLASLLPWGRKKKGAAISIRRLYEEADYDAMAASYARLYARFKTFLEGNNLAHNLA
jgi:hypothetical protein